MTIPKFFSLVGATAALLVLCACSSAPYIAPATVPFEMARVPERLTPERSDDVAIYALGLVGTPYRFGGNTPAAGFDCSGLIDHVFHVRAGIIPPRTVAKLSGWGQSVTKRQARTGDLVLFAQRDQATHAGIYVGDDRFVHAPSTGGSVRLDSLNSSYWSAQLVAFRRP